MWESLFRWCRIQRGKSGYSILRIDSLRNVFSRPVLLQKGMSYVVNQSSVIELTVRYAPIYESGEHLL